MIPVKDFANGIKKDLKSRKALKNSLKFLVTFLIVFSAFLFLILPATAGFWVYMGGFHAYAAGSLLSFFGTDARVSQNILTADVMGKAVNFEISPICSGDIETAILVSLLLASFDILLIWRLIGILIGFGFLTLMNPLRIAITIMITQDSGMEAGDFYHTIIFRLFLFVLLVLYYFLWYKAFFGRESGTQKAIEKRICKRLRI